MDTAPVTSKSGPGSCDRSGFRDPVFLLAPPRSYSTVSIALLAGHPELYGLPETSLFASPTVGGNIERLTRQFRDQQWKRHPLMGVARAIAQLRDGSQDPGALMRALGWIEERPGVSATEIMDHLLRLVYPRIGVEKSPATVASGLALARCLQAYPNARYLHLTRHPVSTQRSMLALYSGFFFPAAMGEADRVRHCLLAWYSSHLRIVQALRDLPRAQWRRVRAEDLIGAPRTWLPRVLDWLSLGHDAATVDRMLRTQDWEFAAWDGEIGFGAADPKFLAAPKLRAIQAPEQDVIDPEWDISDEIRVRITTLARYLGY